MAREHARVKLSIWDDDDFRALSPAAQHLYFVLMTSSKLDYCGVTDWRPARIAPLAGGWSAWAVEVAAQELSEQLYLIIDTASEEVLLRSFIRHDGLMEQPNLAVAMGKAHTAISSLALRRIVVHELLRLRADKPELKGWPKVPAGLLEKASLDPSRHPSFTASVDPKPKGTDKASGTAPLTTSPTPSTSPATATPTGKTEGDNLSGERRETLQAVSATIPTCSIHPLGDGPVGCGGCRKVREWGDRNELAARDEAERQRTQALLDERRRAAKEATPMPAELRKIATRKAAAS